MEVERISEEEKQNIREIGKVENFGTIPFYVD